MVRLSPPLPPPLALALTATTRQGRVAADGATFSIVAAYVGQYVWTSALAAASLAAPADTLRNDTTKEDGREARKRTNEPNNEQGGKEGGVEKRRERKEDFFFRRER